MAEKEQEEEKDRKATFCPYRCIKAVMLFLLDYMESFSFTIWSLHREQKGCVEGVAQKETIFEEREKSNIQLIGNLIKM